MGGFVLQESIGVAGNPQGITVGDFDGDAILDLALPDLVSGQVMIRPDLAG